MQINIWKKEKKTIRIIKKFVTKKEKRITTVINGGIKKSLTYSI